jgi:hypothetical protein
LSALAQPVDAPVCQAADHNKHCDSAYKCGLWLASSIAKLGALSIYTGKSRSSNERVAESDMIVPVFDPNRNDWSPWHDLLRDPGILQGLALESEF